MVQSIESGMESASINPDSVIDSLVDSPFAKSNPMIGGSCVSALVDGSITNMVARTTNAAASHLGPMTQSRKHPVMNTMHR